MGNLRVCALLALAACGSDHSASPDAPVVVQHDAAVDSKIFMDAPPPQYDFTCTSNAAPANGQAPATITMSGTVQEVAINGMTPSIGTVDGASLNACKVGAVNCDNGNHLAGPYTSAGGGLWTLGPINTGTNPVNGVMTVTKANYKAVNLFPPQPLIANQTGIPALTFSNTTFGIITSQVTQSPSNGTMAVFVTDCANMAVDGATVTVKQNGTPVANITDLDVGALNAAGAGIHLIFDVPPGATEVGATVGSTTFRAHVVTSIANELTETIVRPGYY